MTATRTIQIGMVYSARLGKSYAPVKVLERIPGGRWKIQNLMDPDAKPFTVKADMLKGDGKTVEEAKAAIEQANAEAAVQEKQAAEAAKPADAPPAPKGRKQPAKAKEPGKMSGLDAAVVVLAEAGKPMNTTDMVKQMLETGLWKTNGKTPAATVYAAIITEIAKKGQQSRFRKTDRGHFELSPAGIAARTAAGRQAK